MDLLEGLSVEFEFPTKPPPKPLPELTPDERHIELVRRISAALSIPHFRLAFRIGEQLGLDEMTVQEVLAAVSITTLQIDREKREEEQEVRDEFHGEILRLSRDRRGDNARHDSRVKYRKSSDAGRAFATEL